MVAGSNFPILVFAMQSALCLGSMLAKLASRMVNFFWLPLLGFAHEQFVPPGGLTRTFLPLLLCFGYTPLLVGVPDRLRLRSNLLRHFGREGG